MAIWHETYTDPLTGGLPVGKLGAMKYILDKENGSKITKGYHNFFMHKGTLMGVTGSAEERVFYLAEEKKAPKYEKFLQARSDTSPMWFVEIKALKNTVKMLECFEYAMSEAALLELTELKNLIN